MGGWEDAARSHELMPKTFDHGFWQEFLSDRPDIVHRLLGEMWRATAEAPDAVPTIDDLYRLVTPQFSVKPFRDAVWERLDGQSLRELAGKMKRSHSYVVRVLNGTYALTGAYVEEFAKALEVHPSYFAEWRRGWLVAVFDRALDARPNASITLFQRFYQLEPPVAGSRGPAHHSLNNTRSGA